MYSLLTVGSSLHCKSVSNKLVLLFGIAWCLISKPCITMVKFDNAKPKPLILNHYIVEKQTSSISKKQISYWTAIDSNANTHGKSMVSYIFQSTNKQHWRLLYNMVCLIYIATKIYTLRIKRHMCVFVYVYNKTGMDMKNETRWACFIRLWNVSEENGTLIRDWQDPTAKSKSLRAIPLVNP